MTLQLSPLSELTMKIIRGSLPEISEKVNKSISLLPSDARYITEAGLVTNPSWALVEYICAKHYGDSELISEAATRLEGTFKQTFGEQSGSILLDAALKDANAAIAAVSGAETSASATLPRFRRGIGIDLENKSPSWSEFLEQQESIDPDRTIQPKSNER